MLRARHAAQIVWANVSLHLPVVGATTNSPCDSWADYEPSNVVTLLDPSHTVQDVASEASCELLALGREVLLMPEPCCQKCS